MKIYYVEDNAEIRELVIYTLNREGYEAKGFENAEGFQAKCIKNNPDLILLDIMLPGKDGIEALNELKQNNATCNIPIILISAKGFEHDKVKGLDMGADDYIVKPFGVMELLSRIKAVLRRTKQNKADSKMLELEGISIDLKKHIVKLNNKLLDLTPKEFDLLHYLMLNKGIALNRDMLLNAVWGFSFAGSSRTVDVHMQTLRQKLGKKADIIQTVHGIGYKLGD